MLFRQGPADGNKQTKADPYFKLKENVNMRKYLTVKELAEALSVSPRTIIKWRQLGKIPAYKIGNAVRFDLDEVTKAIVKKVNA